MSVALRAVNIGNRCALSKNNDERNLNSQRKINQKSLPKTDGENMLPMTNPKHNSTTFQLEGAPVALRLRVRMVGKSRGAFVPLDQSTKPFVTDDSFEYDRLVLRRRIGTGGRQEVSRRVCPVFVVITGVLADEIVQMLLATDQKVVQAFLLNTLNYAFTAGVEIRALKRQTDRFDVLGFEDFIESRGELCIAVADQVSGFFLTSVKVHQKVPSLLFHPGSARMQRRIGDEDLASFQIDKNQDEIVEKPTVRERFGTEEVAGPKRLGVQGEELIPRAFGALGRWFDAFFFENVANSLTANTIDAEPPQLAENSQVAHTGFAGDLTNQFPQNFLLARSSRLFRNVAPFLLADPAMEGSRCDDLDQAVDLFAQQFAEFEQAGAFCLGRVNLLGQAGAKDGKFLGEILHVPGQSVVGRRGDQQQEWVKQPGHRGPASKGDNLLWNREIALFLYTAGETWTTLPGRKRLFENKETSPIHAKRQKDSLNVSLLSL